MLHLQRAISSTLLLALVGALACGEPPAADTSEADIQAIRAIYNANNPLTTEDEGG